VLSIGTDKPEAVVKRMQEKGDRLADSPLYKKVLVSSSLKRARGPSSTRLALVKLARSRGDAVGKLIDDLGLRRTPERDLLLRV